MIILSEKKQVSYLILRGHISYFSLNNNHLVQKQHNRITKQIMRIIHYDIV